MSDLAVNITFKATDLGVARMVDQINKSLAGIKMPKMDSFGGGLGKGLKGKNPADNVRDLGKGMYAFGHGMERTANASRAALESIVDAGVSFEEAITRTMNAGGSSFIKFKEDLIKDARELGQITKYSAIEVAEGMRGFAQAGMTPQQIMGAMPSTIDMAIGGMMGLDDAVNVVTNTMSQFGLKSEDTNTMMKNTAMISDMMAKSANMVTADVKDFAVGMEYAGTQAAQSGLSLQSTLTIMSALATRGIKGSKAGTGIRSMMGEFMKMSKTDKDILKSLGIGPQQIIDSISKDDFGGVLKAFDSAIKEKGLSGIQAQQLLGPMFSANARTTFFSLLDTMQKVGADGRSEFEALGAGIRDSIGEGAMGANALAESSGGKLQKFNNQMLETKLVLSESVLPALTELLPIVGETIRSFADWAKANPETMKSLAGVVVKCTAFLAIVGPIVSVVGSLVTGIGYAWPILAKFATWIAAPIAAIIGWPATIGLAVVALGYFLEKTFQVSYYLKDFWNMIVDGGKKLIEWLVKPLDRVIEKLTGVQNISQKLTGWMDDKLKFDQDGFSTMVKAGQGAKNVYASLSPEQKDSLKSSFFGQSASLISERLGFGEKDSGMAETLKKGQEAKDKRNEKVGVDVSIKVDQNGRVVSAESKPRPSSLPSVLRGLSTEGI